MTNENFVRKVGQSEQVVESSYTEDEIRSFKEDVFAMLDERDALRKEVDASKLEFKKRFKDLESRLTAVRENIKGKRRERVAVDLMLTKQNEVVRVNRDTGEILGRRTATQEELQEDLFPQDRYQPSAASPSPDGDGEANADADMAAGDDDDWEEGHSRG